MRILLDENLDWRLGNDLVGHEVASVQKIGWAGITNGKLIELASVSFDVLITMDAGLSYQQNLVGKSIAVIVLRAPSNRLADTRPLIPAVVALLDNLTPGTITIV